MTAALRSLKPAFHDAETDTDILATILATMSASEDVGVGVGVGVVECGLYTTRSCISVSGAPRILRRESSE